MPKPRTFSAVACADAGDLHAGERAGVQAELGELLPHRAHRVGRGEHHPLVAAVDQALDRALHLGGRARRLDGDGRHLLGAGAVHGQPLAHRAGLVLGPRHQHPPAVQRARLPPGQLGAQPDLGADGEHQRAVQLAGVGGQRGQRGLDGALRGGGAVGGDRDRRLRGHAVLGQPAGHLGQVARRWRAARAGRGRRRAAASRPRCGRRPRGARSRAARRRRPAPRCRRAPRARRRTAPRRAATACASCTTESTVSGSPLTRRVTRGRARASATRSSATSAGSPTAGPHLGVRRRPAPGSPPARPGR